MRRTMLVAAAALVAAGLASAASVQPITLTVDCSKGQKISDAVTRGDWSKPVTITVRGTCNESVFIARDGVTLQGDPRFGATVNAPGPNTDTISVAANGVAITGLTVTGGRYGIWARRQSEVAINKSTISGSASHGIRAVNAALRIGDGTTIEHSGDSGLSIEMGGSVDVSNCQIGDNAEEGIYVTSNSVVNVNNATISANGGHGVLLDSGSQGNFSYVEIFNNATGILVSASQANIVHGNFIHDNHGQGVNAQMGAVIAVDGSTITHNEQGGVVGYLGSTVVMHGNEVTDNTGTGVACHSNCTLQIEGARITRNSGHGVVIQAGSTLTLYSPQTNASGNHGPPDLWCGDKESSANGLAEYFVGISSGCTGFND